MHFVRRCTVVGRLRGMPPGRRWTYPGKGASRHALSAAAQAGRRVAVRGWPCAAARAAGGHGPYVMASLLVPGIRVATTAAVSMTYSGALHLHFHKPQSKPSAKPCVHLHPRKPHASF